MLLFWSLEQTRYRADAEVTNVISRLRKMMEKSWNLLETASIWDKQTNKLVNKAANDSARVSGQDRKKLPALGTNQIAGFGGFRPLASLEKNKIRYWTMQTLRIVITLSHLRAFRDALRETFLKVTNV